MQTQDLVLLGLLVDGPRHGYELKQAIDTKLTEIAQMSSGTVYYTLRRLEREGHVASSQEKKGNRPERTVYEITAEGKKRFQELLRESLFHEERPYFTFDVGLFFSPFVGLDVLEEAIDSKVAQLERYREKLAKVESAFPGRWPFHLFYIREHARVFLDANEEWLRRLKNKVTRKKRDVPAAASRR